MSDKLKNVWKSAVDLDVGERAELAGLLLGTLEELPSVDEQNAIDAAWAREFDRRYQAYQRGEIKALPISDLLDMVKPRESK